MRNLSAAGGFVAKKCHSVKVPEIASDLSAHDVLRCVQGVQMCDKLRMQISYCAVEGTLTR